MEIKVCNKLFPSLLATLMVVKTLFIREKDWGIKKTKKEMGLHIHVKNLGIYRD